MEIKEPRLKTLKRLFAASKNQCAFPGCNCPIAEKDGVITGIVCLIKARNKGGPRYDLKQNAEERHDYDNLILLCSRHSKIIDSLPKKYTVDFLKEIKSLHEQNVLEISKTEAQGAERLLDEYRVIYVFPGSEVNVKGVREVHAENIHFNSAKPPKFTAPSDVIASSSSHKNYVKHLIDRYNEFASQQKERPFKFQVIYENVKTTFGAKWDAIKLSRFDDLCDYLQKRIERTRLGRINKSKGQKNYSQFDVYCLKYESPKKT